MELCIIGGAGHVGLVTGACLAEIGHRVTCVDSEKSKIKSLNDGHIPFFEPDLLELVKANKKKRRLRFTTDIRDGVKKSRVIFISVSTPARENGDADLSYVENVSRSIAVSLPSYRLIVEKSTVPVETGKWVKHTINVFNKRGIDFDIASNPEFLREGSAVRDFMRPDRIIIGAETERAKKILLLIYKPIKAPIVVTDINSAELIKHASNSFLAAKISFINAVSTICERAGGNINEVARGVGMDKRIGESFFNAGLGFGGSCFPKDLSAFIRIAERVGYDFKLLKEVQNVNDQQKKSLVKKVAGMLWNLQNKKVCVLGLSFKPDTDDIRSAPSLDIIPMLQKEGVTVRAYDPRAMKPAKKLLKGVTFCRDPYEAVTDCDCLVIVTEWDMFNKLDFDRVKKLMRQPVIVDGRNLYSPSKMRRLGFKYQGIGIQ
ncbi:MAG: UDP-glucose/GDP-mannose dehydrogenase family protein [Candidatus Omnitrophota bacterium]